MVNVHGRIVREAIQLDKHRTAKRLIRRLNAQGYVPLATAIGGLAHLSGPHTRKPPNFHIKNFYTTYERC